MAKETGEMIREMLIMMLSRKENDNAKDGMYVNVMLKILNEYKFSTNCKTKTKWSWIRCLKQKIMSK